MDGRRDHCRQGPGTPYHPEKPWWEGDPDRREEGQIPVLEPRDDKQCRAAREEDKGKWQHVKRHDDRVPSRRIGALCREYAPEKMGPCEVERVHQHCRYEPRMPVARRG